MYILPVYPLAGLLFNIILKHIGYKTNQHVLMKMWHSLLYDVNRFISGSASTRLAANCSRCVQTPKHQQLPSIGPSDTHFTIKSYRVDVEALYIYIVSSIRKNRYGWTHIKLVHCSRVVYCSHSVYIHTLCSWMRSKQFPMPHYTPFCLHFITSYMGMWWVWCFAYIKYSSNGDKHTTCWIVCIYGWPSNVGKQPVYCI